MKIQGLSGFLVLTGHHVKLIGYFHLLIRIQITIRYYGWASGAAGGSASAGLPELWLTAAFFVSRKAALPAMVRILYTMRKNGIFQLYFLSEFCIIEE